MENRMESMPASHSILILSGSEPLLLKFMVPTDVALRSFPVASAMVSAWRIGSPSHPCPYETIGSAACKRCGRASSTISSGVGTKLIRSWFEGQHSEGCRLMQPRQRELHAGEVGKGASQRR